jgi:hypothetical protein
MTVGGLVGGANIMDLIIGGKNPRLNAGRVNGKAISHTRYQRQRENQLSRMRNQGQTIDNRAYQNAGDFAWNIIIERELIDQKIKELGLEVSLDEIYDFLLLTPPIAFQTDLNNAGFFSNEDGKFDLLSYQTAVENGSIPTMLEPLLLNWETYLRTWLADRKLRTLYNNLASVSDEQVKRDFIKKNINCTLDYIYLTLSVVPDSVIEVSDDEIKERYEETKDDSYTTLDTRSVVYVLFKPSPATNIKIGSVYISRDTLDSNSKQDETLQEAWLFAEEAEYSSFKEAVEIFGFKKLDTLDIHEDFTLNSGIPFQMGVLRPAVRFAFDSSIGSLSEPITTNNGIAIFHILSETSAGYKPMEDIKENIRRTLKREHKKNYAVDMLSPVSEPDDWEILANSDSLFQYNTNETSTLGGSFPGIGKSNQLTGTLMAMEAGEMSNVIETYNAVLRLIMTSKDSFDDSLYQIEYNSIRDQILNTERNRGYTSWLIEAKKNIKTEDYRSEVY